MPSEQVSTNRETSELFQVKVTAVNTHCPPRKTKRLGHTRGYKTTFKRVIITVKDGQLGKIFASE